MKQCRNRQIGQPGRVIDKDKIVGLSRDRTTDRNSEHASISRLADLALLMVIHSAQSVGLSLLVSSRALRLAEEEALFCV